MQIRTLLATLSLAGVAVGASSQDEIIKSSDQKKLAKTVDAYWTAKDEVKDIQSSFLALDETMAKVNVALKKKKGPDVLSAVNDWENVFWSATQSMLAEKKVKKGKVTVDSSGEAAFTYLVGKKYSTRKGPVPLLLIVPDEGQKAADVLDADWVDAGLRAGAILVVVHPEGNADEWGGDAGFAMVMTAFGSMKRTNMFGFDFDRVFLAGTGKGFSAAAATATYFPHLFAGLIGRGDIPTVNTANLRNLPTYLGGGGQSDAIEGAIGELGFGNCTKGEDTDAAIWAWLQGQSRDAYPAHIVFSPPSARARGAHWLSVTGVEIEAEPKIEAVADREANSITITAEGISTVTVLYNDVLLDLERPVRVIVNGGAPHEELVSRNARWMIDLAYDVGDWGRVFTAYGSYDVPTAE